jgi:uncharacterized GH25 family protein
MKLRLVIVAVIASLSLIAAGSDKTSITVTVKDRHDKPLDNATVILDFLGSRQIHKFGRRRQTHWEVHTNQEGFAHFPPVPQGTIQLQIVAKNHQTFGKKFDIDTDQKAIDVKLNPPQEQYTANPAPK